MPAAGAARGQWSCSTLGHEDQDFNRELGAEKLEIQLQISLFPHPLCSGFEIEKKGSIGFIICAALFFADGLLIKYLNYYCKLVTALQTTAVLPLGSTGF